MAVEHWLRDVAGNRSIVSGVLFAVLLAAILWEIWMLADKVPGDTISAVVRRINVSSGGLVAIVWFGLGLHWFINWPSKWHTDVPALHM